MVRASSKIQDNPYMKMCIERVREDAIAGVSLARRAYAERESEKAATLGIGISAGQQARKAPVVNEERARSLASSPEKRKSR